MERNPALVVLAARVEDTLHRSLAAAAVVALDRRHPVRVLDLVVDGFAPAMSAEERRAYHTDQPILDPQVRLHADLVMAAGVLVFVYPTAWWSPPPVLKAWLERVIVPGVGVVFDARHRVRPTWSRCGPSSESQPTSDRTP
jgi:NAD(P)H dehydrogenase (quinone)